MAGDGDGIMLLIVMVVMESTIDTVEDYEASRVYDSLGLLCI